MNVSELIRELQGFQDEYGDLPVTISSTYPREKDIPDVAPIVNSGELFVGYDRYDDHDEINIRSFPY